MIQPAAYLLWCMTRIQQTHVLLSMPEKEVKLIAGIRERATEVWAEFDATPRPTCMCRIALPLETMLWL